MKAFPIKVPLTQIWPATELSVQATTLCVSTTTLSAQATTQSAQAENKKHD